MTVQAFVSKNFVRKILYIKPRIDMYIYIYRDIHKHAFIYIYMAIKNSIHYSWSV